MSDKCMRHDGCGCPVFYVEHINRYVCMCLAMGTGRIVYETKDDIWIAIDEREPNAN